MGQHYRQLGIEERCEIARLSEGGASIRQIAAALHRAASSVARELKRNSGTTQYVPTQAQQRGRARRWRGSRLDRNEPLRTKVLAQLDLGWSPEQIAERARRLGEACVGAETIYRFIHAQIRRTNDTSWRRYLPRGKSRRGWGRRRHHPMEHIKDRVSITERPQAVDNRRQAGHWEADLLHPRKSGAAVLVAQERKSRFIFTAKQAGKHARPIADQLQRWLEPLPKKLRRSLTQDNGPEFFEHHQLNPIGIKTYFCNPHSPWQTSSGFQSLQWSDWREKAMRATLEWRRRDRKPQRPHQTLHPRRHRPRQLHRPGPPAPRPPPQQHAAKVP